MEHPKHRPPVPCGVSLRTHSVEADWFRSQAPEQLDGVCDREEPAVFTVVLVRWREAFKSPFADG